MYLALAGVSVLWAYKPEVSSIRYFQQVMIIISMVLPALLAARSADILLGVFLCFALASVINLFFVVDQNPLILENGRICYAGYFTWKGVLGECAAISILLALYEILQPGWRRIFAIMVIGVATYLVVMSDSKGSLAIALPAPLLAGLIAVIAKKTRVSPAILVLPIPIFYTVLSYAVSGLINRISWYLYGNYTLSGRTIIWDFAKSEIARKPLLGWGYQSFWNIGPDGPSILDAPGWVKDMPSAHSGYLDTQLEMGYVGLVFLVVFIFATLHAIGRVVARDPARAWLLLTIAFYVILTNFIEAGWMRGSEMLWVLFVIVAAEAGRYWQPYPAGMPKPVRGRPVIARRRPDIARVQGSSKLGNLQKRRR
jgi:O-antigen ligase